MANQRSATMGFRDVVVGWFGEGVARKVEQFVDGVVFEDDLITCRTCARPVAAALMSERGQCPVCGTPACKETMIETLEAQKRAALASGSDAINLVEEIDRRLIMLRAKR
jgi:hypothetical protein